MPWEKPPLRRLSLPTCTTVRSTYEENWIGRRTWLKGDEDLLQGNVWYGGLLMLSIHNERMTFGCCCRFNFQGTGKFAAQMLRPRECPVCPPALLLVPGLTFSSIDASMLQYRKGSLEHDDHRLCTKYSSCSRIVALNIPRKSQLTKSMKASATKYLPRF